MLCINLELSCNKKAETYPQFYQQHVFDIRSLFPYHNPMYTAGSKIETHVSAAAVMSHQQHGSRIHFLSRSSCSIT